MRNKLKDAFRLSKTSQSEQAIEKTERAFWSPTPAILLTALVYFGSQIIAGILIYGLPKIFGVTDDGLSKWLDTAGAQFSAILIVEVAVVLMLWPLLRAKRSSFKAIGLRMLKFKDIIYALAGFSAYFVIFLVLSGLVQHFIPEVNFNQQQELGFKASETGVNLLMIFIGLVILPPIVEEILIRGFLYKGLRSRLSFGWTALIASLLFGAAHLQFGTGNKLLWIAALDTFTLSLVLVYLREKTDSLGAPIALHMLKNGLAFMLLFVLKMV